MSGTPKEHGTPYRDCNRTITGSKLLKKYPCIYPSIYLYTHLSVDVYGVCSSTLWPCYSLLLMAAHRDVYFRNIKISTMTYLMYHSQYLN